MSSTSDNQRRIAREAVARYTDQPTELPAELRAMLDAGWEPVRLYALADLDAELALTEQWVLLGERWLAVARSKDGIWSVESHLERSEIVEVRESGGLSCTCVFIVARDPLRSLALRYTHRQRRAMANLVFVLQQRLQGREIDAGTGQADTLYRDALAGPIREAQGSVAKGSFSVVLRLLKYLGPYRRQLALGMAGAGLMTVMSLVPPFLAGYLVDRVIRPFEKGLLTADEAARWGGNIVLLIAFAYLLKELFAWVRFRTMSVLGELVARDLRDETFAHLQKLSVSFFSSRQTGSLISRVTSDSDRIWDFIAFGVVEVSVSLLMLSGLGAVLIWLDWRLGLLVTIPIPLFLAAFWVHGERMQRLFLRAWRKWSALTDVLSDTIPGIRVVKAFHQEEREKNRFVARNFSCVSEFNRIHAAWTTFWPMIMFCVNLVVIGVWVFGLPRVFDPQGQMSAGTFVSFLFYMTLFTQPIEVIGQMARMLNRATSSAYRIFELLDTEPTILDVADPVRLPRLKGRVTFEKVSFGYDGVRQILKGVSFDVRPGEMIGLVGPSGAGKTTLINLLARFYEPTGGRILIDGVELARLDSSQFRQSVGMVLQDPYLFHGTILENIRYGLQDASLERVVAAAKAANAHEFILKLPHGYDTVVGERGHTLSGGERQRVSIARAVLHDPSILILDEATSSVDTETERKIQDALDRLIQGRTVFAIAHRLSTLTRADRIFVVEDGRILEHGTHLELLERPKGTYRKLYELQKEVAAC